MADNKEIVENINNRIIELDKKIDNIGNENIINHSTVNEINGIISDINKDIKKTERKNKRITCIRNIKIFGRTFQGVFPYLVVCGMLFTAQTMLGDVPIYPQEQFKFAHHEETIDYTGIVSDKVTYNNNKDNMDNSAYFVSKWEQKSDGRWYRAVKEYGRFKDYSLEDLLEMAKNKDINFEEIFGKVQDVKFEVSKEVPTEEIEKGDYLKIIHRYKNEEDVMLIPQDFWANFGLSALYLFLCFIFSMGVAALREEHSNYNWKRHLNRIKRNNANINLDEIKKLFDEKKIKFERKIHPEVVLTDPITHEASIVR